MTALSDGLGVGKLPARVGRYELLHELASGGMATVYLGRALGVAGFERIVAIKVCHAHLTRDDEFVAMFLDEARLAAKIHHPNVVATLDVGIDGLLHMVMEYIEGDRLLGVMRAARRANAQIPIEIALRIIVDTVSGLHAAHELCNAQGQPLNIVHRDVSPQNVLVGFDGITKLADFGIAKAEARAVETKVDGAVKGKVPYMAPEQLLGESIDRQVDIFAIGVVLWETLTGRRLFRGDSEPETMRKVLHEPIHPPSTYRSDVPPELDAVVMHTLARARSERFRTASAVAEALENCRVKIASQRAVSAYMRELLGAEYSARVELKKLLDSMPRTEPSTVAATAVADRTIPSRRGAVDDDDSQSVPGQTGFPSISSAPKAPVKTLPSWARYAGVGLVALVVVGVAMRALSPSSSAGSVATPALPPPIALTVVDASVTAVSAPAAAAAAAAVAAPVAAVDPPAIAVADAASSEPVANVVLPVAPPSRPRVGGARSRTNPTAQPPARGTGAATGPRARTLRAETSTPSDRRAHGVRTQIPRGSSGRSEITHVGYIDGQSALERQPSPVEQRFIPERSAKSNSLLAHTRIRGRHAR
jgi:serine/threonine protein kinase